MSGRARDIVYGRRGGGWVDPPRQPAVELTPTPQPTRPAATGEPTLFAPPADDHQALDTAGETQRPERVFAPDLLAASRAHDQQCGGRHQAGEDCPAVIDPGDLAAVWAGRARMARARKTAGVALNDGDRAALAWLADQEPDQ